MIRGGLCVACTSKQTSVEGGRLAMRAMFYNIPKFWNSYVERATH